MDHRRKGEERALSFYLGVMSDRKNYEPSRDLPNFLSCSFGWQHG